MDAMTEKEFAAKIMNDKNFRREIVDQCYDYVVPEGTEEGMAQWLNEGAKAMGYEFDIDVLDKEITEQVNALNGFKKIKFVGSIINMARKAKKAHS